MNILMIAQNDPAGRAIELCKAINAMSEHRSRLVTWETRYGHNWGYDIHLPYMNTELDFDEVVALFEQADIIHFHMCIDENIQVGPLHVKDYVKGKTIVHHHHGHPDFRNNPQKYRDKYRNSGRLLFVATPDLLQLLPDATWLPNVVRIDEVHHMPRADNIFTNEIIRIAHSPTRKELKNTEEFLRVTEAIKTEYPQIEVDVIENTAHIDCLLRKRRCQIVFDHMQGYFGISSLESLSQGTCVIAGLNDFVKKHIQEFTGVETIPWVVARSEEELDKVLRDLLSSPEKRRAIGNQSRLWMENHWDREHCIARYLEQIEA